MANAFQLLSSTEPGAARTRAACAAALTAGGVWEQFVEVRMGAGPTVRIEQVGEGADTYEVTVAWGESQAARSRVRGQEPSLQAADRLALALYEIRNSSSVAD